MVEGHEFRKIVISISQPQADMEVMCFKYVKDDATTTTLFLGCTIKIGPGFPSINDFRSNVPYSGGLYLLQNFEETLTYHWNYLSPDKLFPLKNNVVPANPNMLGH